MLSYCRELSTQQRMGIISTPIYFKAKPLFEAPSIPFTCLCGNNNPIIGFRPALKLPFAILALRCTAVFHSTLSMRKLKRSHYKRSPCLFVFRSTLSMRKLKRSHYKRSPCLKPSTVSKGSESRSCSTSFCRALSAS